MDKIVKKLSGFDTTILSDALDSFGLLGAIAGIYPLTVKTRIAGIVKTVKLGPAREKNSDHHLGTTAISKAGPENILFIDNQGREDCSSWGGLLSLAAKKRGVAGVISNGFGRDIDEMSEMGFPFFARGATPISARGRAVEVETGGAVFVGGVSIREGDYAVADQTGVVVIPRENVAEIIEKAGEIKTKEGLMAEKLKTSSRPDSIMNSNYDKLTEQKK